MLWGIKWYLWLILLVAIIVLIFAWSKALSTARLRKERMKKEAAIWKRDYDLRQNFSVLTEAKLNETEDSELLHGVAMNIQVMLEKETDMNEKFNSLPLPKKYIYALEYFDEDVKNKLSLFFKNNGAPLVPIIPDALNAIGAKKYTDYVSQLIPMYDADSDVSVDYDLIEKLDQEFKEIYNSDELLKFAAAYIKNNRGIFID